MSRPREALALGNHVVRKVRFGRGINRGNCRAPRHPEKHEQTYYPEQTGADENALKHSKTPPVSSNPLPQPRVRKSPASMVSFASLFWSAKHFKLHLFE